MDMNITKDIKSVTYLKSRTADLLEQINNTHRPVIITQNGEPRAILQDPQSYERMRYTIGLLKLVSQGEKNIEIIIGRRFKKQGMSWSKEGAQALLKLRVLKQNKEDWDKFFEELKWN